MTDSSDMKAHMGTYNVFTKLFRWGLLAVVIIVVAVVWMIS
ncbi:aa3-type cytochrome c oxidase subunit IV [Stakelama sp. CBK3Z-3]|uniref:Aa3-type cytochrome c oxidase subunit IV n=1 Tax=Stakelama flava TaxID=2860338 RepID=A0ABS6XJN4_9SPHN|nr:aa3-type cytochrome c oxidase subunit IV [Stakelama flava]MBW4330124.1 aa3-type cytochrome c oxidase subunit IV [Stakelama flava]